MRPRNYAITAVALAILLILAAPAVAQDRAPCGPDPIARQLLAEPVVFDGSNTVRLRTCGNRTMRSSYMLVLDVKPEGFEPGTIFRSSQLVALATETQLLVTVALLPAGPPVLVGFATITPGSPNRIAVEVLESPAGVRLSILVNGISDFSDFAAGTELSPRIGSASVGEDFVGTIGPIVLVELVP